MRSSLSSMWQKTSISRRSALLGLGALGLAGLVPGAARAGQQLGKPAADFTLVDLSGAATRLADQRGKVVLLDFWASWCEPCMKELPELEGLYKELAPKGVVFLGVNLDQDKENATRIARRFQLSFKVLLDPQGKVAEVYDPPKMPSSYILDKAGVIRHLNAGFAGKGDIERLRAQLTALLS